MSVRYVCGIIKDYFGRYLTLDYSPAQGTIDTQSPNKCTISVEAWVSPTENSLDVLVREISEVLSIPLLEVLTSLDLRSTRVSNRMGVYCKQELTTYVFIMDGVFRTKCTNGARQQLLTLDQINRVVRTKQLCPTTCCKFVVENMNLWELVA